MSEKASGRKNAKDNAPGWSAWVTEDSALFQEATLVGSPRRPRKGRAAADKKSKTEKDMIKKVKAWDLYSQGRAVVGNQTLLTGTAEACAHPKNDGSWGKTPKWGANVGDAGGDA